jgi:hypothetical protein
MEGSFFFATDNGESKSAEHITSRAATTLTNQKILAFINRFLQCLQKPPAGPYSVHSYQPSFFNIHFSNILTPTHITDYASM